MFTTLLKSLNFFNMWWIEYEFGVFLFSLKSYQIYSFWGFSLLPKTLSNLFQHSQITMKHFWRFTSKTAQSYTIFIIKRRRINTLQHPPSVIIDIFSLFKASIPSHQNHQVAVLRNKLLLVASDSVTVTTILNDNVQSLISSRHLFLALLNQFNSHPSLLLQVLFQFNFIDPIF
jgi:hypothetical protein